MPVDPHAEDGAVSDFEAMLRRKSAPVPAPHESVPEKPAPLTQHPTEATPAAEASSPGPAPKKAKPHFHDHRDRLRDKFTRRGADAFDDYELLELILFQALPRIDTKPIAKTLIERFGSLAEVVAAPVEKLTTVKGIGPNAARQLKILQQVAIRVGQSSVLNRPVLSSWNALLDYCRAAMQFEGREQFRVLFLDKKNRLLAGLSARDRPPRPRPRSDRHHPRPQPPIRRSDPVTPGHRADQSHRRDRPRHRRHRARPSRHRPQRRGQLQDAGADVASRLPGAFPLLLEWKQRG